MNPIFQTVLIYILINLSYNMSIYPNIKSFGYENFNKIPIQISKPNRKQATHGVFRNSYSITHSPNHLNGFQGFNDGFYSVMGSENHFQTPFHPFGNSLKNFGHNPIVPNNGRENNAFYDFIEPEVNNYRNNYVSLNDKTRMRHKTQIENPPKIMNTREKGEYNIHNNDVQQNSGQKSEYSGENSSFKCPEPQYILVGIPVPQKSGNDGEYSPIQTSSPITSTMPSVSEKTPNELTKSNTEKVDIEKAQYIVKMIDLLNNMEN